MDTTQQETVCGIILITGYLGSGKTTFIQHLLKHQNKYKVAVIQNEYSDEMGIEAPLMQMADGKIFDKFYELPNGCLCCSAKEDLHRAIEFLCESEKYNLDYILVETNGLADPSNTIKSFWLGEDMLKVSANLRVIYCIVGAHAFEKNIENNEIYLRQLIFADLVLLNHTDRVEEKELENIEGKLRNFNPTCKIVRTQYCNVPVDELFSHESFNSLGRNKDELENLPHEIHHEHAHPDEDIEFLVYEFEKEAFDYKLLEQNIATLLWEKPQDMNVIRCKGLINISDSKHKYSLQGVDDIFEIKDSNIEWEKETRGSKFLFIGKKLLQEEIRKLLQEAIIKG